MIFSLGTFTFFSAGAPGNHKVGPDALQRSGVSITRPNVPGACVVNYGISAGRPFDYETLVDVASVAAAETLHGTYRNLAWNGHYQLIWQSLDYDTRDTRFIVQYVHQPEIWTPALSCGGLNNLPVWLRTRWTLQASPTT